MKKTIFLISVSTLTLMGCATAPVNNIATVPTVNSVSKNNKSLEEQLNEKLEKAVSTEEDTQKLLEESFPDYEVDIEADKIYLAKKDVDDSDKDINNVLISVVDEAMSISSYIREMYPTGLKTILYEYYSSYGKLMFVNFHNFYDEVKGDTELEVMQSFLIKSGLDSVEDDLKTLIDRIVEVD